MAFLSRVYHNGDGGTAGFNVPFGYLSQSHVEVYVDDVLKTEGAGNHYTWTSPSTITFTAGNEPGAGTDNILFKRVTPKATRNVDFQDASSLTEAEMDEDSNQLFYIAQEAFDEVSSVLSLTAANVWDAESKRITNVGTPTASTDAATKAYADSISAAAGNVPTPGDPGEDDYVLKASGGLFTWAQAASGSLADNSVTLAKMEDGTAGDILYYGASGAPTRLAKGAAGKVLEMGASYPQWGDGTPTGAIMGYMGASAPTGWLLLNGATLGDTGSGATHAGPTYQALYEFLWDNVADSEAAVSSGRGGSAAADFAAGKTLTMPDATGRALFGHEASATRLTSGGAGVDGATMGDTGGSETHQLTTAELAAHTHTYGTEGLFSPTGGPSDYVDVGGGTYTSGSTGGDTAHTNLPPAFIASWIIKL